MNCPVCGQSLREVERSGVAIDICPGCKGVWLDRGELEKLIAREAGGAPGMYQESEHVRSHHDDEDEREHREHYEHGEGLHRRKKRGFLGDLFDFD